jgi:hypothetical protein
LWLAETSQQPISTWLKVTPYCNHLQTALLVVALHHALFNISGFAFHHSFFLTTSYLSLSLMNNMALAETST